MFENIFKRVVEKVAEYSDRTWETLPLATLAHVNIMKTHRAADLIERLTFPKTPLTVEESKEKKRLEDTLIDIIAYAAKTLERVEAGL